MTNNAAYTCRLCVMFLCALFQSVSFLAESSPLVQNRAYEFSNFLCSRALPLSFLLHLPSFLCLPVYHSSCPALTFSHSYSLTSFLESSHIPSLSPFLHTSSLFYNGIGGINRKILRNGHARGIFNVFQTQNQL